MAESSGNLDLARAVLITQAARIDDAIADAAARVNTAAAAIASAQAEHEAALADHAERVATRASVADAIDVLGPVEAGE